MGPAPKLLVLQLNRIGELALTTPALQALRDTWPNCHITLVLTASCEDLIPALPKIDEALIFDPNQRLNHSIYRHLLRGRFDACLDFTGTDRSALMALCSRSPRRIAFPAAKKGPLRSLIYQHFVHLPTAQGHEIDRLSQLIRPLGVTPPAETPSPILSVSALSHRRVSRLLNECGISGDFALIHPGSAAPEKYWLPERWAELILRLQHDFNLPCVLTGGADSFEQNHLREIQTALAVLSTTSLPHPLVKLAGLLDLSLLTALAAQARLVVACDTATAHIASAFQRPQVTLFGPTDPLRWRPISPHSKIICAAFPDTQLISFDLETPSAPMTQIPTKAVVELCSNLLSHGKDGRKKAPLHPQNH